MFRVSIHTHNVISTIPPHISQLQRIFYKNSMASLADALIFAREFDNLPAVAYVMLYFDRVLNSITSSVSDREFVANFDFVEAFTHKETSTIEHNIHIPQYNLLHVGNVCHLNSCINMLSSLSALVKLMNETIMANTGSVSQSFSLIAHYIMNSYSEIDLNPSLMFDVAATLNIDIYQFAEATETMKSILREFYANGIDKSMVFYWDTTDEFYESDLSLGDKIAHFGSKYLIVNVHDMNTLLNKETDKVEIDSFRIRITNQQQKQQQEQQPLIYQLSSIVIHMPGHFISAFNLRVDGDANTKNTSNERQDMYKILDDMSDRFDTVFVPAHDVFHNQNTSHVLACYVRVDGIDGIDDDKSKNKDNSSNDGDVKGNINASNNDVKSNCNINNTNQ